MKFMKRNNLSVQRRTTIVQKDPSHLTTKLVKHVMHVRRLSMKTNFSPNCIIAMDETAVWSDMVGNIFLLKTFIRLGHLRGPHDRGC